MFWFIQQIYMHVQSMHLKQWIKHRAFQLNSSEQIKALHAWKKEWADLFPSLVNHVYSVKKRAAARLGHFLPTHAISHASRTILQSTHRALRARPLSDHHNNSRVTCVRAAASLSGVSTLHVRLLILIRRIGTFNHTIRDKSQSRGGSKHLATQLKSCYCLKTGNLGSTFVTVVTTTTP